MLQMMADAASLAHSRCRDDNLGLIIKIDHPGLVACNRSLKSRKDQRIDSFLHQSHRLFIKAGFHILIKYVGGFNRQRAVYIDFESLVLGQ